jgi:hypothetical protein
MKKNDTTQHNTTNTTGNHRTKNPRTPRGFETGHTPRRRIQ